MRLSFRDTFAFYSAWLRSESLGAFFDPPSGLVLEPLPSIFWLELRWSSVCIVACMCSYRFLVVGGGEQESFAGVVALSFVDALLVVMLATKQHHPWLQSYLAKGEGVHALHGALQCSRAMLSGRDCLSKGNTRLSAWRR